MSDDTVLKLSQPSTFSDPLTEVLRSGARSLLARAVEAEVAAFLDGHSEARTEEGRRRLVRHGHLPEREIMTGIGPVAVRAPRVRDRGGGSEILVDPLVGRLARLQRIHDGHQTRKDFAKKPPTLPNVGDLRPARASPKL